MTVSSTSALSAPSIIEYMSKSLPKKASQDASPPAMNTYAAIALFCHACMLAVGFRFIGLGEDHKSGE